MSIDDDLFDYDPDQEDQSTKTFSYDEDHNLTSKEQDFVDSIKESISDQNGSINALETNLAIAFVSSVTKYIQTDSLANGHLSTTRILLDELTNGRFSLLELFKTTEHKILKMMAVLQLSESLFSSDHSNFSGLLQKFFNIEVSHVHIRSTYNVHIAITRHALLLNRTLYSQLSETLDLPVIPELFDDNSDIDKINISYHNLVHNIHTNIISELSSSGLTSKVSEVFGTDVQLYKA